MNDPISVITINNYTCFAHIIIIMMTGMILMIGSRTFIVLAMEKQSTSHVSEFGRTADGDVVQLITLRAMGGTDAEKWTSSVEISTYGAAIVRCWMPGRSADGRRVEMADVALGFDRVATYERNDKYLGVIVGRVSGRIANGQLCIPDQPGHVYQLTKNLDGAHCLHGGRSVSLNRSLLICI